MTPNMYTNSGIHILKEVALDGVVGDLPEREDDGYLLHDDGVAGEVA